MTNEVYNYLDSIPAPVIGAIIGALVALVAIVLRRLWRELHRWNPGEALDRHPRWEGLALGAYRRRPPQRLSPIIVVLSLKPGPDRYVGVVRGQRNGRHLAHWGDDLQVNPRGAVTNSLRTEDFSTEDEALDAIATWERHSSHRRHDID